MFGALAKKFIGSANDRVVKRLEKPVAEIAVLEPSLVELSDAELAARTVAFREMKPGACARAARSDRLRPAGSST